MLRSFGCAQLCVTTPGSLTCSVMADPSVAASSPPCGALCLYLELNLLQQGLVSQPISINPKNHIRNTQKASTILLIPNKTLNKTTSRTISVQIKRSFGYLRTLEGRRGGRNHRPEHNQRSDGLPDSPRVCK